LRRRRKQLTVGLLVLGLLVGAGGFGTTFAAACSGSLDTYRTLSAARSELDPERQPPPAGALSAAESAAAPVPGEADTAAAPAEPASAVRRVGTQIRRAAGEAVFGVVRAVRTAGHAALSGFLALKQSDVLAYPIHSTLAQALEFTHCPRDAIWVQWIKAGIHATRQDQVLRVASALRERATSEDDISRLRDIVQGYVQREPWSQGIQQVQAAIASTIDP
jgi:hypothetical protein